MRAFAKPLARLIEELTKMPGVGPKTGQRLAYYILQTSRENAVKLADAILEVKDKIRTCSVCNNFTDKDPCDICTDLSRDASTLAVVAEPRDVAAMERSGEFKGVYHVLQGLIAPMEGIGPEELKIRELLDRIGAGIVKEVIIATNPNVEGEATAIYLSRLLKPMGVKVSRIASGIPFGGDLDYADEITINRAIEGRREL